MWMLGGFYWLWSRVCVFLNVLLSINTELDLLTQFTLLEVFSEMSSSHPNLRLLFITPERISQSMRFLSQVRIPLYQCFSTAALNYSFCGSH